jgi:hypothetical protein
MVDVLLHCYADQAPIKEGRILQLWELDALLVAPINEAFALFADEEFAFFGVQMVWKLL